MTLPSVKTLYEVPEATWPQASDWEEAGFTIRDGQGGGHGVSSPQKPARHGRSLREAP